MKILEIDRLGIKSQEIKLVKNEEVSELHVNRLMLLKKKDRRRSHHENESEKFQKNLNHLACTGSELNYLAPTKVKLYYHTAAVELNRKVPGNSKKIRNGAGHIKL